jgi:ABC-2 type transport system ATP-binding protein
MIGIRTRDLRKVYHSAPPFGAGGFGPKTPGEKKSKQPKPEIVALDGLSLEINAGEVFGLLGPNGAGKSTTVGILTTRVRPTGGEAWIGPHDVWKEQVAVKRLIGVVAQRPNLDFSLTAREILLFHGAYFGLDSQARSARAESLLDRFKLRDRA